MEVGVTAASARVRVIVAPVKDHWMCLSSEVRDNQRERRLEPTA